VIPRAFITEWRTTAPWQTDAQIEQDLAIFRAIVEIYSDEILKENLVFRGGTAIHKLYLAPAIRYSEDIDLIQKEGQAIGPLFDRMKERLDFLGNSNTSRTHRDSALVYRFQSEIPPVSPLRLKVEINCREHFSVFGFQVKPFQVQSRWFGGEVELPTFTLEDLLGSKMRALYQRRKGRDLLDLWYAITAREIDTEKVLYAFSQYMESFGVSVTRREYEENLRKKMTNRYFLGDTVDLLRPDVEYDPKIAFDVVMGKLITKLN
jgi:predicted nucleotidyltransferase component of viral defense system